MIRHAVLDTVQVLECRRKASDSNRSGVTRSGLSPPAKHPRRRADDSGAGESLLLSYPPHVFDGDTGTALAAERAFIRLAVSQPHHLDLDASPRVLDERAAGS